MEPSEADPFGAYESSEKDVIVTYGDGTEMAADDQQGAEHVIVLEVPGPSEQEDGTLVLTIEGKKYIVAENEDGKQYLVQLNDDDQPILTDFEDDYNRSVDDGSHHSEPYIEPGEVPQERNSLSDIVESEPTVQVDSEPLGVSESEVVKAEELSTEGEFTQNPFIESSAPQGLLHLDSKHPNLMQLACVAECLESQSVEQNNLPAEKDSPIAETQTSVIVSQTVVRELSAPFASPGLEEPVSLYNAVSVIHSTVSDDQISFERHESAENSEKGISHSVSMDEDAIRLVHSEPINCSSTFEKYDPDIGNHESMDIEGRTLVSEIKLDEKLSADNLDVKSPPGSEKMNDKLETSIQSEKSGKTFPTNHLKISQDLECVEASTSNADDDNVECCVDVIPADTVSEPPKTDLGSSQSSFVKKCSNTALKEPSPSKNFEVDCEKGNEYIFNENELENTGQPSGPPPSFFSTRYSSFSRKSKMKTLYSTHSSDKSLECAESSQRHSRPKLKSVCPENDSYSDEKSENVVDLTDRESHTKSLEEGGEIDSTSTNLDPLPFPANKIPVQKLASLSDKVHDQNLIKCASPADDFPAQDLDNCASAEPLVSESISHVADLDRKLPGSKCTEIPNGKNSSISVYSERANPKVAGDIVDEPSVKPPKKTYVRQKTLPAAPGSSQQDNFDLFSDCTLNLSEIDKEINETEKSITMDQQECENNIQPGNKSFPDNIADSSRSGQDISVVDDLSMNVEMKVSATYDRKRKATSNQKQSPKITSLRPRSSAKKPDLNGFKELSSASIKSPGYDPSNSENIPWGDVLMRTKFQPPASNDAAQSPSAKKASSTEKKMSPAKQKQLSNKLDRKFDSLLKSKTKERKKMSVIAREAKKVKSKYGESISLAKSIKKLHSVKGLPKKHKRPMNRVPCDSRRKKGKRAKIEFSVCPRKVSDQKRDIEESSFFCSSCDFSSTLVDNLIEHLKYCAKSPSPIDFSVDDMDKRQRIRGEDLDVPRSEGFGEFYNSSLEAVRGECSGSSHNQFMESDDDEEDLDFRKSKYGYGEDDVVWAKVEDRFWPGLVCELKEKKAFVKLINYPTERKGLKKNAERVHTFDDAKWNKMLLAEAENLPNNEIFVKAVQTSETFVRKKWLGQNVKGKDFFSLPDKIEFCTDNESSDSNINEDSDSDPYLGMKPSQRARYEEIDAEAVKNYILAGHLDKIVLDIYNQEVDCSRHKKYFQKGRTDASLTQKSWFGPCENMFEGLLVDHFHELFLKHIGKHQFSLSYILEVWIPEAIIRAISAVQDVPRKEAEALFESEDSSDRDDPSLEDIKRMYSSTC